MLETFAQFGELIGGIGALAALVYLAVQIRQSNTVAKAQSRQTLLDTFAQTNWEMTRETDLLRVFSLGVQAWPEMPNEDKTLFDLTMSRYIFNLHNGLLLRDARMLDEQTFDFIADFLLAIIDSPGGGRWWNETSFANSLVRDYINKRLENSDGLFPGVRELMPHWYFLADLQTDSTSIESHE
jgi:hypothetical protein